MVSAGKRLLIITNDALQKSLQCAMDEDVFIYDSRVDQGKEINQYAALQKIENQIIKMKFISGAAMLFRSELPKKIGLLDSRFIHYTEDKDYCYTARENGYLVIYVPTKGKIFHKGYASNKKVSGLTYYFRTRNYLIFNRKHLSPLNFFAFLGRFFLITFFMELVRHPKLKKEFIKGIKDGILTILKDKLLLLRGA